MKFYSFSTFHRKRKTKPLVISTEGMITSQKLARKNVILRCVSRSTAGANQRTKTVNKFSSRTLFYGSQQYFDSTCGNVNIVCKGKTKFYSFFMSHFLGYVYTMNDVFVIMPTSNEKLYRIILIQTATTGR